MIAVVDFRSGGGPDCGQPKSQPGEEPAEVVASGGQHRVDGVVLRVGAVVAAHSVFGFEMTDDRFDG